MQGDFKSCSYTIYIYCTLTLCHRTIDVSIPVNNIIIMVNFYLHCMVPVDISQFTLQLRTHAETAVMICDPIPYFQVLLHINNFSPLRDCPVC